MNRARRIRITRAVTEWFRTNARPLPWRTRRRSGYASLVSEAMLQQTQVSRVIGRFDAFMKRFPTVRALARADDHDVLAMWQGLGYYRRARNLHAAAQMIVDRFNGRVPSEIKDLLQLPGVGRYTAGAIASIVYDRPEPIVDGNVHRVLTRVFADESRKWKDRSVEWVWAKAAELVPYAKSPGAYNEGLMELGATMCLPAPGKPRCSDCPLSRLCAARKLGVQDRVPKATPRPATRSVHHHAVIVRNARTGKVLLEQRPSSGMWANMWQVPTIEAETRLTPFALKRMLKAPASSLRALRRFHHKTTHRLIEFHVFAAKSRSTSGVWRNPKQLGDFAISNAQKRVLQCLSRE